MIFFRKLQQNNGLIVQWTRHGGQSVWKCGRCVSICADSQSWRGKTVEIGTHFFCAINYICCKSSINSENAKDWTWVKKYLIIVRFLVELIIEHFKFDSALLMSQLWLRTIHFVPSTCLLEYLDTVWMINEFLILSKSLSEVFEKKI